MCRWKYPVFYVVCLMALVAASPVWCQESYDGLVARTVTLIKSDKNTNAQALARKLVAQDAARYEGHLYLGITFFNQDNYDAAEAELQKALNTAPKTAKGRVQSALNRTRNTRTYLTAVAEADAALKEGLKAKAAKKYAEAAYAMPSRTDTALKAARLMAEIKDYIAAASLAVQARDAATDDAKRSEAGVLVEGWRAKFDGEANEQFETGLKKLQAGDASAALVILTKFAPLLSNRTEGMLTVALTAYAAGDKGRTLNILKQWIQTPSRKLDDIIFTRIAATYSWDTVSRATADPEISSLLGDTFGEKAVAQMVTDLAGIKPSADAGKLPLTKINPKDGAEMVLVPAGPFPMGEDNNPENPRHIVRLSAYYIYKNVVTVAMYEKFCVETKREMPSAPDFNPNWSRKDHPIVNVSWDDAKAYCDWAEMRLPTEAEWERAARGIDGRKYPWGNGFDTNRLQCSKDKYGDAGGTAVVGKFPSGASPYGVLDMAGNVWQWCADWYDKDFPGSRQGAELDPMNQSVGEQKSRIARGGSCCDNVEVNFRSAFRLRNDPAVRNFNVGFRCCLPGGL